jgi:hypothetical protein
VISICTICECQAILLENPRFRGLGNFLTSAKARGAEIRSHFEWAKTQTLGLTAVLTYLLGKVIG